MEAWKRALPLALAMMLAVSSLSGVPLYAGAEEITAETTQAAGETEPAEETVPTVTDAPAMAAAEEQEIITVTQTVVPDAYLPDNEELYDGYVERLLYGGNSAALYGVAARERLSELGKQLYDFLKENLQRVAAGESSSAVFVLTSETAAGWGAETKYTASDGRAAFAAFMSQFEMNKILDALLSDCPYDLYWFDKVSGINESCNLGGVGSNFTVNAVHFRFAVAGNHQPEGYDSKTPTVDTSGVAAAAAAADRAKSIAEAYADSSDYEKLLAYKEEICGLVSYDYDAAKKGNFTLDDDPWQLIHVFDGDPETKVVCEGYAKAFQYLCDLTAFEKDVSCYTVTGTMSGGTGAGGHMWNIVTIGGKNYLVDVTNSDDGTTGKNGRLFLAGTSGSIAEGYDFSGTAFAYDKGTMALWGTEADSILNLSAASYDPDPLAGDVTGDGEVSDADAVYLLWHTLFPGLYPIDRGVADFDKDQAVTGADAVRLLWHALFDEPLYG